MVVAPLFLAFGDVLGRFEEVISCLVQVERVGLTLQVVRDGQPLAHIYIVVVAIPGHNTAATMAVKSAFMKKKKKN